MTEFTFLNKTYTEDSLKAMSLEDLLSLRNLVASNLGVAQVRGFKDHEQAVEQTVKALTKFAETAENEVAAETAIKAKKEKKAKEPVERGLAKSAMAKVVKRPTREMFATIRKIGEHDGTQGRFHRWANYKDGMTMVDVVMGEGTEPWDVKNWVGHGIMEIIPATDEEYVERRKKFYETTGYPDPDMAKELQAQEKAKRAAERAAAAAEKKAQAEAKKAEAAAKKAAQAESAPAEA